MKKTAILPGGFKPPHKEHYAVAKYLAKKSGANVTVRDRDWETSFLLV